MKRHLLNAMTALSLLLAAAVVVLWVRSYWSADLLTDYWHRSRGDHFLRAWPLLRSERGGISFRVQTTHAPEVRPWASRRWKVDPARTYPVLMRAPTGNNTPTRYWHIDVPGFQFVHYARAKITDTNVTTPHAAWLALFLIAPAFWLRRHRLDRRKAAAAGLCPTCGYDLRATPGRCPECGNTAAASGQ